VLGAGEQVPGAGGQLAGDRRGGDLLPAPFRNALERGGELRGAYGRSSGYCMDPIEKKPLNHFLHGSAVDPQGGGWRGRDADPTLVRMFIIWLILMYGSLFVLVAAAIQLALA
jgi:hypothetical protein